VRYSWQGGKPPLTLFKADVARRVAVAAAGGDDFEDDEDYLHGAALERRHKRQERENEVLDDDVEEYDEDDDDEVGPAVPAPVVHAAAPMPPMLPVPAPPPFSLSAASSSSSSTSFADLMDGAVRAAFRSGIEQGRREQLPHPPCKVCAVRKERNRIAAKESRHKKRKELAGVMMARDIVVAANYAASRAAPAPAPAAAPVADEGDDVGAPPPF
jgi:hypothetical protein